MTSPRRVGSLEIVEDLPFQRRSWSIQRVGWIIMGLLVLAAAAGLFGSGPLSQASARSRAGDLDVRYERFTRYQAPTRLTIRAGPGLARDGMVRIALSREYADAIKIQQVTPHPERAEAGGESLVLMFRQAQTGLPLAVTIDYEPERFGLLPARLGTGEGSQVGFRQFVYP